MNTPRTDAAWAKTFLDDDDQCRAGNAATDMRDACATLERELAALTAEHQRVCEVERELRAEVKRMTHAYEYDHKCLYEVQDRCHLWKQRAEKAEAQLHALRLVCGTTDANKFETWTDRANARAERAEAELATERARVKKLSESSNAQLSLICGELTASEFRTIRAVLGFILRNPEKNIEEVNEN